ncbi:MAG: hypothetical protein GXO61_05850 [Epsilonproteobacteria bacterium]|nr:hypothetical protein [Campylobacterota bacterium]
MKKIAIVTFLSFSFLVARVIDLPGTRAPYDDSKPPAAQIPKPHLPNQVAPIPQHSRSPYQLDKYFPNKIREENRASTPRVVNPQRPFTAFDERQARDLQLLYQEVSKASDKYQALYQQFKTKYFKQRAGFYKKWAVRLNSRARSRGLALASPSRGIDVVRVSSLKDAFVEGYKAEKMVGAYAKRNLKRAPTFMRGYYQELLENSNKAREDIKCVLRML